MDAVTGIGALVFLAGYTLTWFGYARLKGPGMGILDLIVPSRIANAQAVIAGWGSSTGTSTTKGGSGSPSTTTSPGTTSPTTGLTPGQQSQPGGVPGLGGGISGVTASGNPLPVAPRGQNQYPE